jgi:hypothetical protein
MVLLTYLVPTPVFFSRWATKGRGLVPALNSLALGQNEPVVEVLQEGLVGLEEELDFDPDWETFRYLPYVDGHAVCMGNTFSRGGFLVKVDHQSDLADLHSVILISSSTRFLIHHSTLCSALQGKNGSPRTPFTFDSKNVLRQLTSTLREKYNLAMTCGTESEFYLYHSLDSKGTPVKLDATLYGSSQSLHGSAGAAFDEMILANQACGVGVYDSHSEIGPGQVGFDRRRSIRRNGVTDSRKSTMKLSSRSRRIRGR